MHSVLIIDCRDSFVYNLEQILREKCNALTTVVAEDSLSISLNILSLHTHILLSPGPGVPSEHPILYDVLSRTYHSHSILGVCLGMQTLCDYFGAELYGLPNPLHGHLDEAMVTSTCSHLWEGCSHPIHVGRYHSWAVKESSLPPEWLVDARYSDQTLAAVYHKDLSLYGVQFHPESILTPQGDKILANWLLKRE